jgi:hypothetical protein
LQALVDKKLFQPNDPSQFDAKRPETHPGKWTNAPDLHQNMPPSSNVAYEEQLAKFLQELLYVLESACRTAGISSDKYEFMSCANNAIGGSRKPDIVLTSKVKKGNDFGQVRAVIEVKYTSSTSHRKDALFAFIDKSWFMLDDCDQRVHTIGGALCGSIFTPSMLDRGGFLCSEDFDIEELPLSFLQCFTTMTIGTRRAAGYDQEWGAEAAEPNVIDMDPSHMFNPKFSSRQMRFTVSARTFSHHALTGRSTKVLIATRDEAPNFDMSKDRSGNESGSSPVLPPSFPPDDASPDNSPSETSKLYKWLFLPPGSQVAIKDCWPTVEAIPEGYILDCLGGEDLKIDPGFNRINGIPTKVIDRFVRGEDPATGNDVVDSTVSRRRGNAQLPPYKRRVHYRMVTEDVCVDLSWFSHKKEFFSAILKALKGKPIDISERMRWH